jgi:glutaredoxin-related protein
MMHPASYDEQRRVFHAIQPITFTVPVRGRGPNERTAYLHLYCSKEKEADDAAALMERLKKLRLQLESRDITASKKELETYFTITRNAKDEITAFTENQQAITDALSRCGFFALLTSEKQLDSRQVLSLYRKKDKVEKSFNNLKDRLSLRRTRCSRNDNFNGKVFVQFIALMVVSHIRKVMAEQGLYTRYSYRQLLDEVDVIEYCTYRNRAGHWGEITEKQANILQAFHVELPIDAWPKKIQKKIAAAKKTKS